MSTQLGLALTIALTLVGVKIGYMRAKAKLQERQRILRDFNGGYLPPDMG